MPNYSQSTKLSLASAEEPPYLTVGTDVSAKYKGAFCEAKITDVSKHVKLRVLFDGGTGTHLIDDTHLKAGSLLETGTRIEARHPEKKQQTYVQATVTKILDHSRYTVVFDDGDQCILRRNSLCLKSGKHFAESETLDQLPLTNPEHFGNPVKVGAIEQLNSSSAVQMNNKVGNIHHLMNGKPKSKASTNSSSTASDESKSNGETIGSGNRKRQQHQDSNKDNIKKLKKERNSTSATATTAAATNSTTTTTSSTTATTTTTTSANSAPLVGRGRGGASKGRKRRDSINNGASNKQATEMDDDSADSMPDSIGTDTGESNVKFELIEIGVKLMVQYGKKKVQNVYEAKVNKIETTSAGKTRYFVHYTGWNNRYDEWIYRNRIVAIVTDRENGSRDGRTKHIEVAPSTNQTFTSNASAAVTSSATVTSHKDLDKEKTREKEKDRKEEKEKARDKEKDRKEEKEKAREREKDRKEEKEKAREKEKHRIEEKEKDKDIIKEREVPTKTRRTRQAAELSNQTSNTSCLDTSVLPAASNSSSTTLVSSSSNSLTTTTTTTTTTTKTPASTAIQTPQTAAGTTTTTTTTTPTVTAAPVTSTLATKEKEKERDRDKERDSLKDKEKDRDNNNKERDVTTKTRRSRQTAELPNTITITNATLAASERLDISAVPSTTTNSSTKVISSPPTNSMTANSLTTTGPKVSSNTITHTTPIVAAAEVTTVTITSTITTPSTTATAVPTTKDKDKNLSTSVAVPIPTPVKSETTTLAQTVAAAETRTTTTTTFTPIAISTSLPTITSTTVTLTTTALTSSLPSSITSTPSTTITTSTTNSSRPIYKFCEEIYESDCDKKISLLQERMMALRQTYISLKTELADLDRRRKRTNRTNAEHINCSLMCRD